MERLLPDLAPHLPRRRDLVPVAAAVAAASCELPWHGPKASVYIVKAARYDQALFGTVRRILSECGLDVRGKRVVLKPNLVEFEANAAINTHPMVVHAALEGFLALGAREVLIAEGPGHRRMAWDLAEEAGYFRQIPQFEKIFVDLNTDEVVELTIPFPASALKTIHLPKTVLGADLFVSLPKLKTHHWVGVTLSMKNLFGIVPGAIYGWPKNVLHWAGINEMIVDLHRLVPPHFCLVDGIVGMEGNGPIQGTAKAAGVLVAGNDMPAVDATCCRIMRLDPAKIAYLSAAARNGQTAEAGVIQRGEPISAVAAPFAVLRQWEPLLI